MDSEVKIQVVGGEARGEALRFLVAGSRRGGSVDSRAESLSMLGDPPRGSPSRLWCARRGRTCVGAAMVVERPGRTGLLLCSPPGAPGVDGGAVAMLARAISREALSGGLVMVQLFTRSAARDEIAMIKSAGFDLLAELVYMRLDLPARRSRRDGEAGDVTWRDYGHFSEGELADVIVSTYVNSLDCPALLGVRPMADIIASHKASGVFHPASWWILQQGASPAGCILVNHSASLDPTAEVVYVGVAAAFRGRGLGRVMLRHAAGDACRQGLAAMTLAADAANTHAKRLYDSEGFYETERRLAYVLLNKGQS